MIMKNLHIYFLGVCIALGLSLLGYFGSQTIIKSRIGVNTAAVKGLAERFVAADRVSWTIDFTHVQTLPTEDGFLNTEPAHAENISKAEATGQRVASKLMEAGFKENELQFSRIELERVDLRDGEENIYAVNFNYFGSITVRFDDLKESDIDKIENARDLVQSLLAEGLGFQARAPRYEFTGLNEIKPDMLREATEAARLAADEFAKNAGVEVGGIQKASQGAFTVRDSDQDKSQYFSPEKVVRVVVNTVFYLEN